MSILNSDELINAAINKDTLQSLYDTAWSDYKEYNQERWNDLAKTYTALADAPIPSIWNTLIEEQKFTVASNWMETLKSNTKNFDQAIQISKDSFKALGVNEDEIFNKNMSSALTLNYNNIKYA